MPTWKYNKNVKSIPHPPPYKTEKKRKINPKRKKGRNNKNGSKNKWNREKETWKIISSKDQNWKAFSQMDWQKIEKTLITKIRSEMGDINIFLQKYKWQ